MVGIRCSLATAGCSPRNIPLIVLTHGDGDHIDGAKTAAEVIAHVLRLRRHCRAEREVERRTQCGLGELGQSGGGDGDDY